MQPARRWATRAPRLRSDPRCNPRARSSHAPFCRVDDGSCGLDCYPRKNHGCSRRGDGRRGHRASDLIRDATLALDQATRRFAELMMEAAVSTAIRGKTMDAAGEEMGDEVTAPHPMAPAEFK